MLGNKPQKKANNIHQLLGFRLTANPLIPFRSVLSGQTATRPGMFFHAN